MTSMGNHQSKNNKTFLEQNYSIKRSLGYQQNKSSPKKYPQIVEQTSSPPHLVTDDYKQTYKISTTDQINSHEEIRNQDQQNTHVEIDLFKGIFRMAKSKQLAAVSGLIGAFLIHLIIGAIYRWNMITGYVGIFYQTDFQTPIGAPLAMFCAGLTMRLGFLLSNNYGSRIVMSVALVFCSISTATASRMPTFFLFLLFHNVLYGICAGALFLPSIKECHRFFPNMKLITNSIVLTGTGLGAVLFGAYNIQCIQNNNETFQLTDQELQLLVNQYFSDCFLTMSIVVLVIGCFGIILMTPMILRNEQRARQLLNISMQQTSTNYCKTEKQSLTSRVFWVIAIIIFLSSCGNYFVIMNFKNLLAVEHQKKIFLYWILISGALGNSIPRLIWGFLFSRFGFKKLFCVAAAMNISAFVMIMQTDDETLYIIFYTVNSISLGGFMVIFPNVCLIIFGKRMGQTTYSYYWLVFSLSNFFQFGITLILTENPTTSDEYGQVLLFFTICVVVSLAVCCRYTLQGEWKNSLDLVEFIRTKDRK